MKPLISIKTLYRSPIRTLLTFILLAVVTIAFFSQTAEYAITSREFNNAIQAYYGIGTAEIAPPVDTIPSLPYYINADLRVAQSYSKEEKEYYLNTIRYQPLAQEQINAISALPYISSTDARYMTAGVSDTFWRLDEVEFYNYTLRCVIEGTLETGSGKIFLNNCKLLAGNPTQPVDHEKIMIQTGYSDGVGTTAVSVAGTGRILALYPPGYKYDGAYIQSLTQGGRYVFVLQFEPRVQLDKGHEHDFCMSDTITDRWCDAIWQAGNEPDYLETDKYAPLWSSWIS